MSHVQEVNENAPDYDKDSLYTLDDVSVRIDESDIEEITNGNFKRFQRQSGWAMNIRRRVYDTLNVLYAAGYLAQIAIDKFELSDVFGKSAKKAEEGAATDDTPIEPQNETSKETKVNEASFRIDNSKVFLKEIQ